MGSLLLAGRFAAQLCFALSSECIINRLCNSFPRLSLISVCNISKVPAFRELVFLLRGVFHDRLLAQNYSSWYSRTDSLDGVHTTSPSTAAGGATPPSHSLCYTEREKDMHCVVYMYGCW